MCLLQHLYERLLKISHYSHCRAVWEGEYALQISYVSIVNGVFTFVYLSPQKHLGGNAMLRFIYTEAGYGVERWPRLDRVVGYGILC